MRTEMTHYVNYSDMEELIKAVYGLDLNIPVIEECGNDVTLTYNPDGDLEDYDIEDFDAILADPNKAQYRLDLIMNKLVADEKIPAGNYNIMVCW